MECSFQAGNPFQSPDFEKCFTGFRARNGFMHPNKTTYGKSLMNCTVVSQLTGAGLCLYCKSLCRMSSSST